MKKLLFILGLMFSTSASAMTYDNFIDCLDAEEVISESEQASMEERETMLKDDIKVKKTSVVLPINYAVLALKSSTNIKVESFANSIKEAKNCDDLSLKLDEVTAGWMGEESKKTTEEAALSSVKKLLK